MTAKQRMKRFIKAVESEEFGKCPKAPSGMYVERLTVCIGVFAGIRVIENVVVVEVDEMSKPEIRYCLKVCRKLGFEPTW